MFGIGMPEFILIAGIALVVFGPKKLPELAQSLGKAMREFKKATSDLKQTMHMDSELSEVKQAFTDLHSEVHKTVREEAQRPEQPVAALPAPAAVPVTPPPEPPPGLPSAEELEQLKQAFSAWNTAEPLMPKQTEPPVEPVEVLKPELVPDALVSPAINREAHP